MSKVKQVIRLYKDGMSKRAIGRELGLYKSTVNKYVGLAEADPLSLDELLKLEDPVLEKRLTGGNPATLTSGSMTFRTGYHTLLRN